MKRSISRAVVGAALALVSVSLTACGSGNDYPTEEGTNALEVEPGEEFSWNGFHVEKGWTVKPVDRSIDIQETMTSPEAKGNVTNESDEERVVLFEMVLTLEGEDLAVVKCAGMKIIKDQSTTFECPGFGQTMPLEFDGVTVRPITR